MSEPLENEIEEELRKKQLKALWDRFGLYLIAVILIIIMSFGGYEFSKYLGYKNSENSSDQYEKALAVLDDENNSDAIDIFDSLVNESNGYSGLSLFNLSNIAIKEGNKVLALEYLGKAAKDKNLSKKINDFAILKSGYIMLDNAEISNIEDKLSSLLNSTGPFSFYAKEIIALAYYRDNRYQESSKKFSEIANDASSPSNIASRSKIFSEQILSYDIVK